MDANRPGSLVRRALPGLLALGWPVLAAHGRTIWEVSDVPSLQGAVSRAIPGDDVVVAPGVYALTGELRFGSPFVTLRGATGNRDDVVLLGPGMNTYVEGLSEAIVVNTDNITIRDLTVAEWYWHAIHIRGEYDVDRTTIVNVHTLNIGERHVKGSTNIGGYGISEDVLIERLFMEQTETRQGSSDDNYVGGIDAMGIARWTVRDCLAVGIRGRTGGGRGAVFLWNGAADLTVERNVFIDCDLAIAFGNGYNPQAWHHTTGGIIRNNFISNAANGRGLELCYNKDLKVYNNTIYASDEAEYWEAAYLYGSTSVPMVNVQFVNNIIRGEVLDRSRGGWTSTNDIIGLSTPADWFADVSAGDLHLTAEALAAIDAALPLAEVGTDFDGLPRDDPPDIGADERLWYCPGDANLDGLVNGADYTLWADNFGQPGLWPDGLYNHVRLWTEGDFDCSRVVDAADYTIWADHYRQPCPGAPVPAPPALALLCIGGLALARRRPVRR